MRVGRDIVLFGLIIILMSSAFSLSVTKTQWTGNVIVNNTICQSFGIINDGNSSVSVTLKSSGAISPFTLFNTTALSIPSSSTKYFKACFTPTTTGQFNGSININQSNTIYPILITINSNLQSSSGGNSSCQLLPSISQYNSRLSQSGNTSFTVHVKNTCSQPITSITTTIQNAKPDFAYVTGNIPGQLDAGGTLDINVNVDGSKESEGQHNFYLTISGFCGDTRITTNINFNVYVVAGSSNGGAGETGNPSTIIPVDGYVNRTFQVSVSGITSADEVFIDIQPINYVLKSIDSGINYYKANYVFSKDGQYTVLIKVYHDGSLYYQTSKQITIHPPSYTNTSTGKPSVAKILWLVRSKLEVHQPIRVEVRTDGGDPVNKAWVKITLPDGNFLSGDTNSNGVISFDPKAYGYSNGFPEGTASLDVRKTGFAQDMSSPHSISLYVNRIPAQLIVSPQKVYVGEDVTVKLVNKNTGELIDYNGQGKAVAKNETITLDFKNGEATFDPSYNQTYSISVQQNDKMTSASSNIKVTEKPMPPQKHNNNYTLYGVVGLFALLGLILMFRRGGRRKSKPTFRYTGIGKIGSIKSSAKAIPGEEDNVVEVIGGNK